MILQAVVCFSVNMSHWVVYIIETESGKLYTGVTNNLERRFKQHVEKQGASFFHFSKPIKIVFQEEHKDRSHALQRESGIKKMSRTEKIALINRSFGFLTTSESL